MFAGEVARQVITRHFGVHPGFNRLSIHRAAHRHPAQAESNNKKPLRNGTRPDEPHFILVNSLVEVACLGGQNRQPTEG